MVEHVGGFDEGFGRRAFPAPARRVLGREVVGAVSWNMNDTCNYRCTYCTQRFMPDRSGHIATEAELDASVRAFAGLEGCWEIKLSGGEPFQQPGLDAIARRLVGMGHIVSIQTNLSASERKLRAFLEATTGALHVFAASLHLEYADTSTFISRVPILAPWIRDHGVRFCVTSVAVPSRLVQLRDEVAPALAAAGIRLKVQPEKVRGYVREYAPEELAILAELGGHNGSGEVAANYQGRLCWAGARYLVVKSSGEASRCYSASRVGGRHARVGSLAEGFTLADGPRVCPYTYCGCTVPIERGMIQGVARRGDGVEF